MSTKLQLHTASEVQIKEYIKFDWNKQCEQKQSDGFDEHGTPKNLNDSSWRDYLENQFQKCRTNDRNTVTVCNWITHVCCEFILVFWLVGKTHALYSFGLAIILAI